MSAAWPFASRFPLIYTDAIVFRYFNYITVFIFLLKPLCCLNEYVDAIHVEILMLARAVHEIKNEFPTISFDSIIDDEDKLWQAGGRESEKVLAERARETLAWLGGRPETNIAVVSLSPCRVVYVPVLFRDISYVSILFCINKAI